MASPICNPEIPSVHPIPGGMYPGRMIRVQGTTPAEAKRFAINLQCGPDDYPGEDIAFHLNPRFKEMCVFRNHFSSSMWGIEKTMGGLPLNVQDPFEIIINCYHDCFKVALNKKHFCEFAHRLPFHRISHILVDGDVIIQQITFEGAPPPQQINLELSKGHFCSHGIAHSSSSGDVMEQEIAEGVELEKLKVPYVYFIPGGMYFGRIIRVRGSISVKARRLKPSQPPKTGATPVSQDLQYKPGAITCHLAQIQMTFLQQYNRERVALNGRDFCEFAHRIPYHRISHVTVKGDVIVHQISLEGAPPPQQDMVKLDPSMEWKCHACLPFLREVPSVHPIPGGMYPGRMIRVKGVITPEAKRFAINLQCGPNIYPREDIALHLNPRSGTRCIVLNHFLTSYWGDEVINRPCPLKPGDSFETVILCCLHCFKVALNGEHYCEFSHRVPFHRVTHISVDGDVMIQQIAFEGAPPPQEMYMVRLRGYK